MKTRGGREPRRHEGTKAKCRAAAWLRRMTEGGDPPHWPEGGRAASGAGGVDDVRGPSRRRYNEFMDIRHLAGEHPVRSIFHFRPMQMVSEVRREAPLGTVRFTDATLTCPEGQFTILGEQQDSSGGGLWLTLKELPADHRCYVVPGGPYKPRSFSVVFQTREGHDMYTCDLAEEKSP